MSLSSSHAYLAIQTASSKRCRVPLREQNEPTQNQNKKNSALQFITKSQLPPTDLVKLWCASSGVFDQSIMSPIIVI